MIAAVWVGGGCSFDETKFQHDCPVGVDVGPEAVCRDGEWVDPSSEDAGSDVGDAKHVGYDAEVVGVECTEDRDCGSAVCVEEKCVPCRKGQTLRTTDRCGFKERGTRQKVCKDNRWVDGECAGVWYRSCLEYRGAHPDASNGSYELDPDGPGEGVRPKKYPCIMQVDDPNAKVGWTQVASDLFEKGSEGWSPDVGTSTCGKLGAIFGGYNRLGRGTIGKTFDLPPIPGSTVRLYLEFVKIDSWDPRVDYALVKVNGRQIWRKDLRRNTGNQICGQGFDWHEKKLGISHDFPAPDGRPGRYTIRVTGVTDEAPSNESWGIDNVLFFVR